MNKTMSALVFSALIALSSAAIADASVSTATEKDNYYTLVYPVFACDDPDIQEAINADIYTYARSVADANEGEAYTTGFHYARMMENERYLSLLFFPSGYYKGAIHGMYTVGGVVYDKTTGKRLPLSHFADVTVDDLIRLWEEGEVYSYKGEKKTVAKLFGPPREVPESYCLTEDGKIFVLFGPYELDCYAGGVTAINVTSLKKDLPS